MAGPGGEAGPAGGGGGGSAASPAAAAKGSFQEVAILDPFSRSRPGGARPAAGLSPSRPRVLAPARPPGAELAMAATDLERFSVRALLGRSARARRGEGAALQPAGGARGCQRRAAGPRRRAGLGAPERALRSASRGARGVRQRHLAGRLEGSPRLGAGEAGPFRGTEQINTRLARSRCEDRPRPRGRERRIRTPRTPISPGISFCTAGEIPGRAGAVGWALPVRMKP